MPWLSPQQPERALMLLLASPFWSDGHEKILSELKDQITGKDLTAPLLSAARNRTSGFVFKNSQGHSIFPKPLQSDLEESYQSTALQNLQKLKATLGILKLLSEKQIPAIPLKGAYAGDFIFEDIGAYPSNDIDILVPFAQLAKTRKLLCDTADFKPVDEISESDLTQSHYHLNLAKDGQLYEIHWNLVKRYFKIDPEFWWQTASHKKWDNVDCMELSLENHILYLIFRLYDHGFVPLKFFAILAGLIHKNISQINWETLYRTAKKYHMTRLVCFVLKFTKEIFLLDIPDGPWQKKNQGYWILRKKILSGLLFPKGPPRHLDMLLYTVLLIEPKDLGSILVGRIFPKPSELRLRYNIAPGSSRLWLYYLLNPVLLLLKKK